MKQQPTLPTFGEIVPGAGGRLGAIMRGALVDGARQPDYGVIVSEAKGGDLGQHVWGTRDQDVVGARSVTDGLHNTIAMAKAGSRIALSVVGLKHAGFGDWYLGARAEVFACYANVPELFPQEWHWTSTQASRDIAFAQLFADGSSRWGGKDHELRVRAFRRIHLQHFTA
ncbi:MAG: hypothetical protein QG643_2433 [Pseudomonadota bacterium]|nr:hypothetical protein [Pseudomonadota bacterium]